jgi:hypothetical protein
LGAAIGTTIALFLIAVVAKPLLLLMALGFILLMAGIIMKAMEIFKTTEERKCFRAGLMLDIAAVTLAGGFFATTKPIATLLFTLGIADFVAGDVILDNFVTLTCLGGPSW